MNKPYYQDSKVTILNGHVITELQGLAPESVHMSVLSPPYWGLRDYGLPPQVWDDPFILHCNSCSCSIMVDKSTLEIKGEFYGQSSNRQVPDLQEASNEILPSEQISQERGEGLLQEPQHSNCLQRGKDKTAESQTQHRPEKHKLERGKSNKGRLCISPGSPGSPDKREEKGKETLYCRASSNNGETSGPLSTGLGESSSQELKKERQSDRKLRDRNRQGSQINTQWTDKMPSLSEIICSKCGSSNFSIKRCEHEWGNQKTITKGGKGQQKGLKGNIHIEETWDTSQTLNQGQFCQKCNAWRGSLGLEPTPELYIQHIIQVFREIWRVLRSDGVIFLNLGDSYWGSGNASGHTSETMNLGAKTDSYGATKAHSVGKHPTLKAKDLCGIPWRVALALQADGWWLRSDIIWSKKNPMPESVNGWRWEKHRVKVKAGWDDEHPHPSKSNSGKSRIDNSGGVFKAQAEWADCPGCPKCTPNNGLILRKGSWRPTTAHEYVFMLTKSDTYFCDAEAVREETTGNAHDRGKGICPKSAPKASGIKANVDFHSRVNRVVSSRNLRSVWTIATQPFPGAHFATFPEKLVEPCIKAGSSEKGCCPECLAPWVRMVEKKKIPRNELPKDDERYRPHRYIKNKYADELREGYECGMYSESKTIGWKPSCECIDSTKVKGWVFDKKGNRVAITESPYNPIPCTVLDCFGGSGVTAIVAKKLGRRCILIELKGEYCEMPLDRLRQENIF